MNPVKARRRPDSEPAQGQGRRQRIARRLARAGLCSRREAERWIEAGRVSVNGEILASPAVTVGPEDRILVDGKTLADAEPTRLWRYHKPPGLVTSHRDPQGRPTVFDNLPAGLPRLISIGRLDLSSEGLLLLTNDGALARTLELPATGWVRRYRARVYGTVEEARLADLAHGSRIAGAVYGPIQATLDQRTGRNAWLTLSLREGRNREVRRVLASLDLQVSRLIRIAYGPFQLGTLPPGAIDEVPRKVLAEQLGAEWAGASPKKART